MTAAAANASGLTLDSCDKSRETMGGGVGGTPENLVTTPFLVTPVITPRFSMSPDGKSPATASTTPAIATFLPTTIMAALPAAYMAVAAILTVSRTTI